MSDSTDSPMTIGRRVWVLKWRLALSWVVCGGLLGALVGLTPEPIVVTDSAPDLSIGLAVGPFTDDGGGGPTDELWILWSPRGSSCRTSTRVVVDLWGASITAGDRPAGGRQAAWLNLLWILPIPLLRSGFSLVRRVRRRSDDCSQEFCPVTR